MEGKGSSEPIKSVVASIIDILAHEYHWSLSDILGLTSGQLKRILRAFFVRKKMKITAIEETFGRPPETPRSNQKEARTFDLSKDSGAFERARRNKFPMKDV